MCNKTDLLLSSSVPKESEAVIEKRIKNTLQQNINQSISLASLESHVDDENDDSNANKMEIIEKLLDGDKLFSFDTCINSSFFK